MSGRIIAGVIGFVVLVLLIQNYVLGDDNPQTDNLAASGAIPTATLPAQTPVAISLGQEDASNASGSGGAPGGTSTYVVKEGDTLGIIATSFNVPQEAQADWIAQVLDLNAIPDARLLQPGQELIIPAAPAGSQSTPAANGTPGSTGSTGGIATVTPTPSTAGGGGEGTYTVASGDTPLGIAEKLCVKGATAWANELVTLNNLNPNNLTVGQELQLPAGTPASCP